MKIVEINPSSKKFGGEIEEIFTAAKKRKKIEREKTEKPTKDAAKVKNTTKKNKKKKKGKLGNENGFGESESRPRKKTEEGLSVYTEEELGLNKADGGGTPLCPFDCSCCF